MKVRDAISREVWYGYLGQRVGEASHLGPMRRLRRSADVWNVFLRLTTQSTVADSDDDRLLVHVSSPHHEVTDVVVPVRAPESRGPHRRGRRARSEGSDVGHVLIDSFDEGRVALVPEPEDTSQSFQCTGPVHRVQKFICPWIPPTLTQCSLGGQKPSGRIGK